MNPSEQQGGERIQNVTFLRHGVAQHNLRDPITGQPPNLYDPVLWDPPLVDQGKQQALAVRSRLAHVLQTVELVVASPLSRCLTTAQLVFGDMLDNPNNPPPLVCLEQVREAYGMHYPDKRRNKSVLQKKWPLVHFDPAMTDRDQQWSESRRETLEDVVVRVKEFLEDWLVQRPENNICVVSHGVWIECCFREYFPLMLQDGRRIYNCDCFRGEIVSRNGVFVRMRNLGKI